MFCNMVKRKVTNFCVCLLQTDFGRHLDELGCRAESLLKRTVCELLAKGKSTEAKGLLELWEAYLKCSRGKREKRTVASETDLFHERAKLASCALLALQPLLPEAETLLLQVQEVARRAREAGALNAGGRFEWVDSLLVKVFILSFLSTVVNHRVHLLLLQLF